MNGLDIYEYHGEGYKPQIDFEAWRVAVLNYAEHFDKDNITKLERHLYTDEVFVLLKGEAFLFIGEQAEQIRLTQNKLYNVKKGVWHAVCASTDAQLLIVENSNTSPQNSEYLHKKIEVKL